MIQKYITSAQKLTDTTEGSKQNTVVFKINLQLKLIRLTPYVTGVIKRSYKFVSRVKKQKMMSIRNPKNSFSRQNASINVIVC